MTPTATLPPAIVLVGGVTLVLACACALAALLCIDQLPRLPLTHRPSVQLGHERDVAAALGWRWRTWLTLRFAVLTLAVTLGILSGVGIFAFILVLAALAGVRFAVAGRAARRRLRMERAFVLMLAELRDRMAVSNQSLDTALLEIARSPARELVWILEPLAGSGNMNDAIVACAERARSPLIEQACGVLIWARTRSLNALIDVIDEVLLPVGSAQLAVSEETLVTLTQQRAVSIAMGALMLVMFVAVVRVASFRAYYESAVGGLVLVAVVVLFCGLIAAVARIAGAAPWTRWDLRRLLVVEGLGRG